VALRTERNIAFSPACEFDVNGDGEVVDMSWNGPAFKVVLIRGVHIMAVKGWTFSPDSRIRSLHQ
jgi:hypothetical protein